MHRVILAAWVFSVLVGGTARAQLVDSGTFNPSEAGSLCGLGFDPVAKDLWVYGCSAPDVQRYTPTGTYLSEVVRPGESANDVDVELAPEALSLNGTALPIGSLFFINGESGVAEIYAVDKSSGAALATLPTVFGVSHVVGGAFHPGRNSFFLVQDVVAPAADENRVAEIDPVTGVVLNTFQIGATFTVNFGDLDVCGVTGNLLVVSDAETTLAEYTPTGTFVDEYPLPVSVSSLSGIGIDGLTGDIWVSSTAGTVSRLTGGPCQPYAQIPTLPSHAATALGVLLLAASLIALRTRAI